MKLKQALIIGLSSAVLAIPAIAAESVTNAKTMKPMTMEMPAKKEAGHHRKDHKKIALEKKVDPKQEKEKAKLDELNTLNSNTTVPTDPEKDQPEKASIAS